MILKRFSGNPILSPNPANLWESLVTTNPGAWYDQEAKQVVMLYRAAGDDSEHKIYFGLASSKDGYHFERRSITPAFSPSADGADAGCVEDARIIKMGQWYYVTYASRAFPPGQYWIHGPYVPPNAPAEWPWLIRENATATFLAMTQDFKTWIRVGRMTDPSVDDRDVCIFPEKIDGKFVMVHRPMNWTGPQFGTENPAIWLSSGDDLLSWKDAKLLAKAEFDWENGKVGANAPPIRTEQGWLLIYHAVGTDRKYRLGAMLLDLKDPSIVRYRSQEPILEPQEKYTYEFAGPYKWGICFPCGNVVINDTLFVYYGGADKFTAVATAPMKEMLSYLLSCPVK